jgi:hypothetical protein
MHWFIKTLAAHCHGPTRWLSITACVAVRSLYFWNMPSHSKAPKTKAKLQKKKGKTKRDNCWSESQGTRRALLVRSLQDHTLSADMLALVLKSITMQILERILCCVEGLVRKSRSQGLCTALSTSPNACNVEYMHITKL